jgi:recombination protein RecR
MAFYLLEKNRQGAASLSEVLAESIEKIGHCEICRTLSETDICSICTDQARDNGEVCIVESPSDVSIIEQSGIFKGQYFVLMGHLSPIDGIGPEELGLDLLKQRLSANKVVELIISLNQTVEGEATIHYIQQLAKQYNVKVTRLAQGIPLGGELEYVDSGTLTQAFISRKEV